MFRERLAKESPNPIDWSEASLETARSSEPPDDAPLVGYLRSLFVDRKPDLIVTIGGAAARFVQLYRSELFPSTPLLITAAEKRIIESTTLSASDHVIAFNLDFAAIVANILQVLPNTKQISVVLGNSPLERYWVKETQRVFQPFMDRIKFIWLNELPFEEICRHIASLPPQSVIFYIFVFVDSAGVQYIGFQPLRELRACANAPMFSYVDTYLGHGIVGGPLLSHVRLNNLAVDAAIRILGSDKQVSTGATYLGLETPVYDWRELQRWNIDEARLPVDSIIQFREPTLWQRYYWRFSAIAAALLLQAAVIMWLFYERQRRRMAELASRGRMLEVIHLNRTAAAGALSASIAHELNQPLGAIQNYADAAERYLKSDPPNLGRALTILDNIRRDDQRAAEIIAPLSGLLKKRAEVKLREFDLNEAVGDAIHILEAEALKRGVSLVASPAKVPLPVRADKIHLEQVILNLALNGLDAMQDHDRRAATLTICSALVGDSGEVSVLDSGAGIPSSLQSTIFESFFTTKQHGTGLGLTIARTIVETYGGRIWAENRKEGGAIFRFALPLARPVLA